MVNYRRHKSGNPETGYIERGYMPPDWGDASWIHIPGVEYD